MSFFRRSSPHPTPPEAAPVEPDEAVLATAAPDEATPDEAAPDEAAPDEDALAVDFPSYDTPVALDPLVDDLPVAVAGVSEWAGDGSTRQKLGHISGGIAPFVTVLPAFVRGHRAPALLVLEDGRTFRGEAYGATGETHGEAVFNTGMTGYQETLTDPSYYGQVVAMTAPHIGNTGYNDEDPESSRIWVAGFVVRDPARVTSNWRAGRTLE
ncbi:MAG: carbamoyl-phosphate synthase small subunit, partial [Frankiaceae bacterium]|nr:carbamoyl-phosphate synthase small subunit [Frankiaceae bacterium]